MRLQHITKILPALLIMLLLSMSAAAQGPQLPAGDLDAPAVWAYSDFGNVFVHTTPEGNTSNRTEINHPLLNGNPKAIVFVTPLWENGAPATGEYVGVWYNGAKWTIYNQAGLNTVMEPGRKFIVQVLSPSESVFQVTQTEEGSPYIYINHPLLNMNPNAQIQVTPTWTVNGESTGIYNNEPIITGFAEGMWVIVNTSEAPMEQGAGFNIQIVSNASRNMSFVHTANGGVFFSALNHPALNGNPNAHLMVTPLYGAFGTETGLNLNHIAVSYANGVWNILNENANPIPVGSQFQVTILNSFDVPINTVQNAGFEVAQPGSNNSLVGWNIVGKAKRTCNKPSKGKFVSYEQYCAAQVAGGNGTMSSITQNISDVSGFTSGKKIYVGARVSGKNVSTGVKLLAIVKLSDDSTVKVKIPASDLQTTYAYKPVMRSSASSIPADAVSAKVKVVHKGTGSLFVDAIYLSTSNMVGVFSEPDALNTIPLPEAAP